jgi:hypothetical protein
MSRLIVCREAVLQMRRRWEPRWEPQWEPRWEPVWLAPGEGRVRHDTAPVTPRAFRGRAPTGNVEFQMQLPPTAIEKKYDLYVTILRKLRRY